jgi:RecB family endonuclease NucS
MDSINPIVKACGYCSMKVSSFFQKLLKVTGLFAFPKIDLLLRWDRVIRIHNFPVESLGDIFKNENQLEEYVMQTETYKQFDIVKADKKYRTVSTKDRFDFKGIDKEGRHAVLELKNMESGKSAVEKVLRYAGMLKQENPKAKIRKILVTRVRGVETAKAIHGITKTQQINDIECYLYN